MLDGLRQRRLEALRGERGAAQAHAWRVEDGVGEGGGARADRALARTGGRQFGAVQQHNVDRFGGFGDVEDRVGGPVGAGDPGAVEGDLLRKGAAGALDDVAFDAADAAAGPVGADDQLAITSSCAMPSARATSVGATKWRNGACGPNSPV